MTLKQKKILSALKDEAQRLYQDGEFDYMDNVNDIIMALDDNNTVLAVVLAEYHRMPEKVVEEIRKTFKVKKTS